MTLFVISSWTQIDTPTDTTLELTTDQPCHLFIGTQTLPPTKTPITKTTRGVPRICGWRYLWTFTSCLDQTEPGDSSTHTWTIPRAQDQPLYLLITEGLACSLPAPSSPPITLEPPPPFPPCISDTWPEADGSPLIATETPVIPYQGNNLPAFVLRFNVPTATPPWLGPAIAAVPIAWPHALTTVNYYTTIDANNGAIWGPMATWDPSDPSAGVLAYFRPTDLTGIHYETVLALLDGTILGTWGPWTGNVVPETYWVQLETDGATAQAIDSKQGPLGFVPIPAPCSFAGFTQRADVVATDAFDWSVCQA